MGYAHITNLYRPEAQRILLLKRVFALEKIHGTSAHISWDGEHKNLRFFSGGMSGPVFTGLFNEEELIEKFAALGHLQAKITVFGEAYGGKEQGMSATYGPKAQFAAFEVRIGETFLAVPDAEDVTNKLGLRFVPYAEGPTDLDWLNEQRDADSIVAQWHGMGPGKKREGIVIRPPFELITSNGERLMAKHKRDDFRETSTPREVSPEALKVLEDAEAIAREWVTPMRLEHVLDKLPQPYDMKLTPTVIRAMTEDVLREGAGELVDTKEARRAIGAMAAKLYKERVTKVDLTI